MSEKSIVRKDKVIREFKEEIKYRKLQYEIFDEAFFEILNKFFKIKLNELRVTISSIDTLVFLGVQDQKYIYLEWYPTNDTCFLSLTSDCKSAIEHSDVLEHDLSIEKTFKLLKNYNIQ